MHKGAFDPCKIEAAGAVPALSTISFPSSHLGEGARLLTGVARFETVGGSQFLAPSAFGKLTGCHVGRTPPVAPSTTCSSVGFRAPCYERGGRGFESLQVGQSLQSVGEPGRPYLPWKQGIAGSNPARLTTSLFNAGLGHRLITWPPTRQSRFESGSPRRSKATCFPGCRDTVLHAVRVENPVFECDLRCGEDSVQLQFGSVSK